MVCGPNQRPPCHTWMLLSFPIVCTIYVGYLLCEARSLYADSPLSAEFLEFHSHLNEAGIAVALYSILASVMAQGAITSLPHMFRVTIVSTLAMVGIVGGGIFLSGMVKAENHLNLAASFMLLGGFYDTYSQAMKDFRRSTIWSSFHGAINTGKIVESTLGPIGSIKLLDHSASIIMTSGAAILRTMNLQNPTTKILVETALKHEDDYGDGTTAVTVLTAELLKEADQLIKEGVSRQAIIRGYKQGMKFAFEALDAASFPIPAGRQVRDVFKRLAICHAPLRPASVLYPHFQSLFSVAYIAAIKERHFVVETNLSLPPTLPSITAVCGARVITIKGSNKHVLDLAKIYTTKLYTILRAATEQLVAGGGAAEVTMSNAVHIASLQVMGSAYLSAEAYGRAISKLPITVFHNAGLDSIMTFTQLRCEHSRGNRLMGIDIHSGNLENMLIKEVFESAAVKKNVISSATEAAERILRVDAVIR